MPCGKLGCMPHRQLVLTFLVGGLFVGRIFFPDFFRPLESLTASSPALFSAWDNALVPLRYLSAYVFVWFAFDNFESPRQFHAIGNLVLRRFGIMQEVPLAWLSYTQGVLELLIAVSFLTGLFLPLSTLIGSVIIALVVVAFKLGNGTLLVRDLGLLGATISLYLLVR